MDIYFLNLPLVIAYLQLMLQWTLTQTKSDLQIEHAMLSPTYSREDKRFTILCSNDWESRESFFSLIICMCYASTFLDK